MKKGTFEALRPENDKDGHLHLMFARLEQADLLECHERANHVYTLASRTRQMIEHYTFYAAFEGGNEYSVYFGERHLGTMPVGSSIRIGDRIIFANQLWTIMDIARDTCTIRVAEAKTGEAPVSPGDPIPPSQAGVSEMRAFYREEVIPNGIEVEEDAAKFYHQGLEAHRILKRQGGTIIEEQHGVLLFPWLDERGQSSLFYALRHWGLHATPAAVALFVDNVKKDEVIDLLRGLADGSRHCPEGHETMRNASSVLIDKHDHLLSPSVDFLDDGFDTGYSKLNDDGRSHCSSLPGVGDPFYTSFAESVEPVVRFGLGVLADSELKSFAGAFLLNHVPGF